MAREKIIKECHICGTKTKLTFEHVPPRAAFNDLPLVACQFEKMVHDDSLELHDNPKGKIFQKGAGAYTLCSKCNNDTGAWYGRWFVDWAYQGLQLSENATLAPSLYYIFRIFPLRVLKQIVCMFFSANGSRFQRVNSELVRFVLNKHENGLNQNIKIYTFFNISPRSRQTGIFSQFNMNTDEIITCSEIAFPPFGYVMGINS